MRNNKVKVLLFNGGFVDTYKLHDGIYWTKVPSVYSEDTTMASLETMFTQYCGENSSVVENLKKCELKTLILTTNDIQTVFTNLLAELPKDKIVEKTLSGNTTVEQMLVEIKEDSPKSKSFISDILRISRNLLIRQTTKDEQFK